MTYQRIAAYQYSEGLTVGKDKNPWRESDVNGNPPFVLYSSDLPVPDNYIDITSIQSYQEFGFSLNQYDYKYIRDALKGYVSDTGENSTLGTESDSSNISSPATDDAYVVGDSAVGDFAGQEGNVAVYNGSNWEFRWKYEHGFDQLSIPEKIIAVEHKIGTTIQRNNIVGTQSNVLLGIQYHSNAVEARQKRMAYATGEVLNRLPSDGGKVMKDIISNANNMFITYVFFGIEGTLEDGPWDSPDDQVEGIADYFYGREGTQFAGGNGLKDKPWNPIGVTMQELTDMLYEILIGGIY